jgi:hypothetical protein
LPHADDIAHANRAASKIGSHSTLRTFEWNGAASAG